MKRKFLLLVMMCIFGGLSSLFAQKTVIIGNDGTSKLDKAPFNLYAINSVCQQIYTVAEFTQYAENNTIPSGNISKLTFYENTGQNLTCTNIKVYMKHTDKDEFSSTSDWITDFTDGDLVFDSNGATLSIVNGVLELTLTTPFTWNRTQSILVYVDVNSRSSAGARSYFKAFSTESTKTLYYSGNYTAGLDVSNWRSGSKTTSKAQMGFTFSSGGNTPVLPTRADSPNPLNNSSYGTSPKQPLEWTFGNNTTDYKVLVGTSVKVEEGIKIVNNTKGQNDFIKKGEATKGSYTAEGLETSTTYFWQVVSQNGNGVTYGDVWNFTTMVTPDEQPDMVTKISPANGTSLKIKDVVLKWQYKDDNHTSYIVYLGESIDKMEELNSGTYSITDYTPDNLQSDKTYYWRVDVKNNSFTTEDPDIWSFTTQAVGNINGVLKDNDTPLIQAKIALKDINDNNNTIGDDDDFVLTNSNGEFEFKDIITGSYKLVVEEYGYAALPYTINITIIEGENNISIYRPAIITNDEGWSTSFGTINEHNELIVKAKAVLKTTSTVGTLTIEKDKSVTISDGAILIVKDKINNNGNLIIEDGGQIFQNNEGVKATFVMDINNWNSEKSKGWQFISSPFTDTPITDFTTLDEHDFYKYDATQKGAEWVNRKTENQYTGTNWEDNFKQGHAYLASYKNAEQAYLTGTLTTGKVYVGQYLNYNPEYVYGCFNLLGNPFPYDIEWSDFSANDIFENGYVVINEKGGYTAYNSGVIKAGDGFFVKTTGTNGITGNRATFSKRDEPITQTRKQENKYINIIASNNEGDDNVIINLTGKNGGFPKMQNINENIANIYINENDVRYCIYNYDSDVNEIEVMFSAKEMGSYTISFDVNGEFETVTLVDRFTGIETNMLIEDEYNFVATGKDMKNRFVVRLGNGQEPTDNGQFVYQSGEELILSIEGSVQIVDMLGRVVYSNEHADAYNRINVAEFKDATYVVRVVNEEGVKTQKVVIY